MILRVMSFLMVIFALGCSEENPTPNTPDTPDTIMTTDGYDKTCAADADCTLVYLGNVCGCGCTQGAIAFVEESRYADAVGEKRKACTDILSCQPCEDTQAAACTQGMCSAVAK